MANAPVNQALMQAQQNAAMRAALLGSAPRMRKNVLTVSSEAGLTSRIKLFNVGVLTKLQLYVTAAITIGTAVATPSAKAPWNLINRLRLTDYDGTDRVNLSGFQLYILNSVRARNPFGYHNAAGVSAAFTNPVVPTAIGNGTVSFFLDVPIAFDTDNPIVQLQDLRGAILAQTAVGEMYLAIDWINSLYTNGDVDALYSGGATTTVVKNGANNINCTVWQEYLLPQAIGGDGIMPLPAMDLMTVYELNGGNKSTDNIAVNTEKLISYPNLRTVIGTYFNYVQASTQTQGKIDRVKLIANGNNVLIDNSELSQLFYQRTYMDQGADLTPGAYFRRHVDKPIETSLFGNVQLSINPTTVGANPYMEIMFESFYTKGQALPGISQGA